MFLLLFFIFGAVLEFELMELRLLAGEVFHHLSHIFLFLILGYFSDGVLFFFFGQCWPVTTILLPIPPTWITGVKHHSMLVC
jgi:hypothetical protein